VEIDTGIPHPARVYDYLLADKMAEQMPGLPVMTRANRAFLGRAVEVLAGELGMRQFLDIGSGLPTNRNVHQVAQEVDPACRVLHVDNDPIVLAHGHALLAGDPAGRTGLIEADARDPRSILADPRLAAVLDRGEPVALMLLSFLMYFPDDVAHDNVSTFLDAFPSGSTLTISHPTTDFDPESAGNAVAAAQAGGITYIPRSGPDVESFFVGLEPVEPGVVPMETWRPAGPVADPHAVHYWVGVARKP
jgi:hypothetical protein